MKHNRSLEKEFDQQVINLLQKGYPAAAHLSVEKFLQQIEPLKARIGEVVTPVIDIEAGQLPFVIVVKSEQVITETAMALVEREGKKGITKLYPREPKDFATIVGVTIPAERIYLLVNIDRGKHSLNITPCEALKMIYAENRSPLTIDEGIALISHYPAFLQKNNCFSLLASRCNTDKRVPAIWINREKQPNLGWCWDGNPHTWLGSASCEKRV